MRSKLTYITHVVISHPGKEAVFHYNTLEIKTEILVRYISYQLNFGIIRGHL